MRLSKNPFQRVELQSSASWSSVKRGTREGVCFLEGGGTGMYVENGSEGVLAREEWLITD